MDAEITISAPTRVFERITSDEIWACTTCKACDENCPVNIEILDKILDMRRYLSLMESDFPTELGNAYRGMENSGNPWGMSPDRARRTGPRTSTASRSSTAATRSTAEYLYWVGCAGSFDDKNKKVTQSMAKLLQRAEVSFAILGPAENCTGDPARRSGNEYIFQMLAMQNIETLDGMGVRKIITQCPHCFNTLDNEYPQLGGHYEVLHHSQFLEELIDTGQLDMTGAKLDERIVYHDSCYLGRHNDVYMAPRNVIGNLEGIEVVEADRNGTKGMCCGAGGARMWMEEHIGKQVNVERSQELLATGAVAHRDRVPVLLRHDRRRGEVPGRRGGGRQGRRPRHAPARGARERRAPGHQPRRAGALSEPTGQLAWRRAAERERAMAGARVLVVDDDDDGSRVLTTVLAAAGFETAAVRDERTAARVVLDEGVAVVVSSFTGSRIASTTTLVGDFRRRPEPQLADAGVVALVDDERDSALGLGAAADEVLVRPVAAQLLVDAVTEVAATAAPARAARRGAGARAER